MDVRLMIYRISCNSLEKEKGGISYTKIYIEVSLEWVGLHTSLFQAAW
jgi:hypothetical protein